MDIIAEQPVESLGCLLEKFKGYALSWVWLIVGFMVKLFKRPLYPVEKWINR